MENPQVLCLGEILFDCLADQRGQSLEQVKSWTRYPGGAPANVACGLAKLGISAGFIGCVGSDPEGEELVNLLQTIGVNTTGIQRHPTLPTRQVYVTRSLNGDRAFAGFGDIATTDFADTQLKGEPLPESLFAQTNYLVLGTIALAYPESRQAVDRAVALAQKYHLKIFLDINWRKVFWANEMDASRRIYELLGAVNYLKCTDEEAEWLFKTQDIALIKEKLPYLKGILMTAGEKGCYYQLGQNRGYVPAFTVKTIDTTGAGDSFVAGFLQQLCQQGDKILQDSALADQAIRYASAAGALTTIQLGAIAAQPTETQIKTFLAQH